MADNTVILNLSVPMICCYKFQCFSPSWMKGMACLILNRIKRLITPPEKLIGLSEKVYILNWRIELLETDYTLPIRDLEM